MILDNENSNLKVHEWLAKYNEDGNLDIVTGYFTVGALAYLSKITNQKIKEYRFILGDIVNFDTGKLKSLDLLNENLEIGTSLKLKQLAQEAVSFLELKEVELKTMEPNFCHAKVYLKTASDDDRNHYFITGSSNLTEAGIGQKITCNIELNIAETGNNNQYIQLTNWFEDLWNKPQAHQSKTIVLENGKITKIPFKQYLIEQISMLFKEYTPEHIFYKILYELFNQEEDDPETKRDLGKLENTRIFEKLYPFQKNGVYSLIKMLNKYNGAILADAVGLGKTWSALAVMKFFQMKGREIVLFCPKKLENNWIQYLKRKEAIFEEDKFDYIVRFHTDLRDGGMESAQAHFDFFINDRPKLFVIDESHNLRNDKSSRYKYLVEEILRKSNGDVKVLLLSATPINNAFKDVRNQFRLMVKGENEGFNELLNVKNIDHTFREVQADFNKWSKEEGAKFADFHNRIKDSDFFRLTDHLLVARTRKQINLHFDPNLKFPKHKKPINIFKTPLKFGDVENFAELLENMQLNLSAYQPSFYTESKEERKLRIKEKKAKKKEGVKQDPKEVMEDNVQREFFLVKMMMILILKRLESSWYSFQITVGRIHKHHENALKKIAEYEQCKDAQSKKNQIINDDEETIAELATDDESGILDTFLFGKKKPIPISKIDQAGMLDQFKKDIKNDKKTLKYIIDNILEFEEKITPETSTTSEDSKLNELLHIILGKQKTENKKIVIFSAYKDTVQYLFDQLGKRGFINFAMVAGDENKEWKSTSKLKKHEPLLERFAPYTKLFKGKNWHNFEPTIPEVSPQLAYNEWLDWIKVEHPEVYRKTEKPIDILLATDVLSEGQNLQDADMVINYDVHWNPVRVIQRIGRIDRIGSPNQFIQSINFWPAKDIDDYINLRERVEKRMALMKLAGSEVIEQFTDDFEEMANDENLEARQNANMLRQMENNTGNIEEKQSIGFADFSFDNYRQLLHDMLNEKKKEFQSMPNGVFSGFKIENNPTLKNGLIALLGYPAQKKYNPEHEYTSHELIYIDKEGTQISNNQKIILEQLFKYYKEPRYVDPKIDSGDEPTLDVLSSSLRKWISKQVKNEEVLDDGTVIETMSAANLNRLKQLKKNSAVAIKEFKTEGSISEKFDFNKFDLITWLIVS